MTFIWSCGVQNPQKQDLNEVKTDDSTSSRGLAETIGDFKLECQWGTSKSYILCGLHSVETKKRIPDLEVKEKFISSFAITPYHRVSFEVMEGGSFRPDSVLTYEEQTLVSSSWHIKIGVSNPGTISSIVLKVNDAIKKELETERFTLDRSLIKGEDELFAGFDITKPKPLTRKQYPEITWSPIGDNVGYYHVRLASDPGCSEVLQEKFVENGLEHAFSGGLNDGIYHVCISARNNAGYTKDADNNAYQFEVDTLPPQEAQVNVLDLDGVKTIQLSAIDAVEMIISKEETCEGNDWEDFEPEREWPFGDFAGKIYAKFRDEVDNETECIIQGGNNAGKEFAWLIINNGDEYTNQDPVQLTFAKDPELEVDVKEISIFNGTECDEETEEWIPYSPDPIDWALAEMNSEISISALFKDENSNISACSTASITHDNIPPSGELRFNGGSTHVNALDVTLNILSDDSAFMLITDIDFEACQAIEPSEPFSDIKQWTLVNENAENSLHFRLKDLAGNLSECTLASVIHDNVPPQSPSINLNENATWTNDLTVNVYSTVLGATQIYATGDPTCIVGGTWQNLAVSNPAILQNANTTDTIYAAFRDEAGNISECVTDTIIHDNIAPGDPTIVIDSGNDYTQVTTVSLALAGPEITNIDMYVTQDATCTAGGTWENYAAGKAWTLANLNAENNIYVAYRDQAGNISNCISDSIIHDTIAPTSSLSFEDGAAAINTTAVSLTIDLGDGAEMYVTNSSDCTGGSWETIAATKAWTLSNLNANNTVYFKFKDLAGNETSCLSDSILHDNIKPTSGTVSIDAGATYATDTAVTLSLSAVEADYVYVTNDASCTTGGNWVAYTTSLAWALGQSNSTATVYASYRDEAGNVIDTCASDTIIHDDIAPTGSIAIDDSGNDGFTNDSTPSLTLSATDTNGLAQMYITNTAGCASGGTEEAYATSSASWPIAQTNNTANVYVKFKDNAGVWSDCYSDDIVHDSINPSGSLTIDASGDDNYTSDSTPSLTISSSDANTVSDMYVTNTAGCASGGSWESYATSKSAWTLGATETGTTVYIKFRDISGNESACIDDATTHDSIAPTSPSISISSGATYATSTSISVDTSATAAAYVYMTNTPGCGSGGTWTALAASMAWNLAQTNSTATVYAKFRDEAYNESSCTSDTITHDDIAPSSTAITIVNSGVANYTNDSAPNLTLSASDTNGLAEMYITNTAGCASGGSEESYSTSKADWTLAQNDTTATVYIKFKDNPGNWSSCINGTIIHDGTAPTGSITISNSGNAGYTNESAPDLSLSATDTNGVTKMYVTNTSGCASGGTEEDYATSENDWTLGQNNTTATVYVKFKDIAGNWSSCFSDNIVHDNIAPTSTSISISSGATYATSTSVSLSLGATGADQMYATNTAGCGSDGAYESYNAIKSWTLGQENTTATVYIKFKDLAQNESSCINDTIIHDGIDPTAPTSMDDAVSASTDETSSMSWGVGSDSGSGVASYELAIGTAAEGTDILDWTDVGNVLSVAQSGLSLTWNNTYYASIRTKDAAGRVSTVTGGDGFLAGFVQESYLKSSNQDSGDEMGTSVAIDVDTAVSGIPYYENSAANNSGAALVFVRSGRTWSEQQLLVPSNVDANDHYGFSVAVSGDTLVVGSPKEDSNSTTIAGSENSNDSAPDSGAVFVYTRSGATWTLEAYIKPSNSMPNNQFGYSVALDGDTLVVGAPYEDGNQTSITNTDSTASPADYTSEYDSGAVYVFKRSGTTWTQDAYIKSANNTGGFNFGKHVAVDSSTLVVGVPDEDSNQTSITNGTTASSDTSLEDSGAVFVYLKDGGGSWAQEAYIKASNNDSYDSFGSAISVSSDTIVVGAPQEDSNAQSISTGTSTNDDESASGAAYIFTRSGTTWSLEAYIKGFNTEAGDLFAHSVAVDGDDLVVGSYIEAGDLTTVDNGTPSDNDNSSQSGACYIYARSGTTWTHKTFAKAPNNDSAYHYCKSVDLDSGSLLVGSAGEDSESTSIINGTTADSGSSSTDSGALYIIKR